jgi:hypothetical protein
VSPQELFADDDTTWDYPHRYEDDDEAYEDNCERFIDELNEDDDAYRRYCNYEGPSEEEMSEPYSSASYRDEYPTTHGFGGKKDYPCDVPPFHCPFKTSEDAATSSYFCRDHCGMGVDD